MHEHLLLQKNDQPCLHVSLGHSNCPNRCASRQRSLLWNSLLVRMPDLGRLSPCQPQFHAREPSVGHSAWTAWRACPSRSQCLRIHYIDLDIDIIDIEDRSESLFLALTCVYHNGQLTTNMRQRHQPSQPRHCLVRPTARRLCTLPCLLQTLTMPLNGAGYYFMNLTLAHIRQVLYAVCSAKRSCVGGWNVPVSHLWKGLIFHLPGK